MSRRLIVDFACNLGLSVDQIAGFIATHWLRPTVLSDRHFYRWQFLEPIGGEGKDYCVVALLGDEIVGFLGLNKRVFNASGERLNGAELTTWIVKEECRGTGVAKGMLELVKTNFEIAYGANITTDAVRAYMRMGFNFVREVPRLLRIYDFNKVAALGKVDAVIPKVYKISPAGRRSRQSFSSIDIAEIEGHWIDRFDRSPGNLMWRYKNHPIHHYHALRGDHGTILVYRIEEVAGVKVMITTDILFTKLPTPSIVDALDDFAFDHGIDFIDFFSSNGALNTALTRAGFIPCLDLRDFIDLAYLYNPLEVKSSKSYSLISYLKEGIRPGGLDVSSLHITKADCDLDRPNPAYLEKIGKAPHETSDC
ncbi:GNAT family N-acetyltransferase [Mesorhizobium sp. CN2-181]|uniref:GNAT family N-acetyltransferase n=1 Tax=Mesorhizobium yinganensis TaxID=3157707 RepID=UPI0032B76986